jgi:hypothetical protein
MRPVAVARPANRGANVKAVTVAEVVCDREAKYCHDQFNRSLDVSIQVRMPPRWSAARSLPFLALERSLISKRCVV